MTDQKCSLVKEDSLCELQADVQEAGMLSRGICFLCLMSQQRMEVANQQKSRSAPYACVLCPSRASMPTYQGLATPEGLSSCGCDVQVAADQQTRRAAEVAPNDAQLEELFRTPTPVLCNVRFSINLSL